MLLTTRVHYAVTALAALVNQEKKLKRVTIAAAYALNPSYLDPVLTVLRRAGMVSAVHGPGGGYALARPAEQISLYEVFETFEERLKITRCNNATIGCQGKKERCVMHRIWQNLEDRIRSYMCQTTIADIAAQMGGGGVFSLEGCDSEAYGAAVYDRGSCEKQREKHRGYNGREDGRKDGEDKDV